MNTDTIKAYIDVAEQLKYYKKLEAEMRIQILDELFPSANEGTLTASVEDFIVKGTFKNSASVDKKKLDSMLDSLTDSEYDCFNFKPTLLLSNYKRLDDQSRINECITFKPAMPTISIKLDIEE